MSGGLIVAFFLAFLVIVVLAKTAVVVPQQNAYVVERLGKYSGTLNAGFHILIPFLDVVRYKHSLKEEALDIAEQVCITRDNVQVGVDGVLYLKVLNPERASYGIATIFLRSPSSRKRRFEAKSARSNSTGRSRNARTSTFRL